MILSFPFRRIEFVEIESRSNRSSPRTNTCLYSLTICRIDGFERIIKRVIKHGVREFHAFRHVPYFPGTRLEYFRSWRSMPRPLIPREPST